MKQNNKKFVLSAIASAMLMAYGGASASVTSPVIGPLLWSEEFNAATQKDAGNILPVVITVYKDKTFTFNPAVAQDITGWTLSGLSITSAPDSEADFALRIRATSTSYGSTAAGTSAATRTSGRCWPRCRHARRWTSSPAPAWHPVCLVRCVVSAVRRECRCCRP